jgi:hypothetical protein
MPRRAANFTANDLTRAIRAALRAGLAIGCVRIEPSGAITLVPGKPEDAVSSPSLPSQNPWDEP